MISIQNERDCCGCAACAAACPVSCITMRPSTLGSLFPTVDTDACVNCGRCDAVCPIAGREACEASCEQSVFAAYSTDADLRRRGSSGGMFETFARHLLKEGYEVYGAAFDGELKLRTTCATTEAELAPLCKSKYLQCDACDKYAEIAEKLKAGGKVLFVSTPCQVAALKRYLGRAYEGLLTVDFLCHGVPSQELFDRCLAYEDGKNGYRTTAYAFRTKIKNGATPHYLTVTAERKGKQLRRTMPYFRSPYYAFFQQYVSMRESCYDCVFSDRNRPSDITVGDFHGIDRYVSGINRFDGVSTVVVNTAAGKALLDAVRDTLFLQELSLDALMADRTLFVETTKRPKGKDAFIKSYHNDPFDEFVKKNTPRRKYLIYSIYYRLPRPLRAVVKKVCHID